LCGAYIPVKTELILTVKMETRRARKKAAEYKLSNFETQSRKFATLELFVA